MNADEFKIQVMPLKDKLYRIALRILNNRDEAKDATQDTFLRIWEMRDKISLYRNLEAFAVTIAKNRCIDMIRKKKFTAPMEESINPGDNGKQPGELLELKDNMNSVGQIVNNLPEKQKLIFHLRDIEQFEYDEIAAITGMNINAIKTNLSRARKKIREVLIERHKYEYREY